MRANRAAWVAVILIACMAKSAPAGDAGLPKTTSLLKSGKRAVRIVCFGDSITGVYYHTGARRAWADMLGIALQRAYPRAKVQMINAGVSGHTTVYGLRRIKRDVLDKQPDLVVVMFGMNDVVHFPLAKYSGNLRKIVNQCRGVGAEVVLCTPNSIYPDAAPRRPVKRLAEFAAAAREVAKQLSVPLADCYASYEQLRAEDPLAWQLLMSETIHPNLQGHKRFAELITTVISGRRVSLADVGVMEPCIPHALARLAKGEPIKVVAMEPYDEIITRVFAKLGAKSDIQVTRWPAQGQSLAQLERWARGIRRRKPDLVLVAVPQEALPPDTEKLIRSYSWVLNWSLHFERPVWDVVAILPSATKQSPASKKTPEDQIVRQIIIGKDIGLIERRPGDDASTEALIVRWFREQQAHALGSKKGRE